MNELTPNTEPSADILSESDILYERATTGQRFLNLLIDNLFMGFGLSYGTGIILGWILVSINPEYLERLIAEGSTENILMSYMLGILNHIIYYTITESLFQGVTLGKLITGTKAVREDGSSLRFKDALLRTLCRLVPFETLSGFGIPWHDSWTNTTVIKTR